MLSLLEELYDEGLSLWVEGDALKLEFGEEAPPPDLIQQLKEKKAQLIAFLKSHQIWDVDDFESLFDDEEIPDVEEENGIEAIFPATSLQQGFIYHHISEPEDDAYRVQMLFDFHHALDIAAFQEAWRAASQQFPILRTAFDWEGEVLQIITRSPSIDAEKFTFVDLRAMNAEERARKVLEVQQHDRAKPFDLTEPGLLRITLMQQAEDLYTVLLSIHHAITDGWSSAILWQTVFAHYTRIQQGLPPEIKIDTAYPATQAFYQQQKSATKSYWDERRGTYPPANNVSALLTHDVDLSQIKAVEAPVEQRFILKGNDYFALKKMCQQESVTLNVAIQFAWHKILQIFSGDKQTVVGTTVSGRDVPIEGIESSVGLYINTLPLLVDWSLPAQSVRATLQAIQQDIADLNTHSSISLAGLNSESDRLFNSLFVFESYPMPESDGSADEALGRVVFRGSVEKVDYPLSLTVYEENNSLVINLGHSEAWLSVEGANNILQKLAMLLRQMTGDPTQPCAQLTILDDSERHQILTEFNPPELSYPAEQSLQNLVEDQVVAGPDRVALVFGKEQLTYAQLNAKANQLAHEIRATYQARYSKPMPTGAIVGLYFKRSLELVIATLAIVKAGGAYLPLSVSYPKERVGFLLEDTGTDVVLTSAEHKAELTSLCHELNLGPDLLDITDLLEHSQASTANLSVGNSHQDLLYVIYTSGTTGKPKGVLTPHQGVVSLVMNNPYVMVSPKDVFLFLSDISFDAATFEMWAPLTHGATLVVSQTDAHSSVEQMRDLLFGHSTGFEVSILFITKALFDALYLQDEAIFSRLHTLLTGGEVASVAVFRKLLSQPGGPTRLLNVYGPTETTTFATAFECAKSGNNVVENVPIGRPINTRQLYILNEYQQPVPVGIVGELYIGGAGVALGYLNRPELTDERFVPNPFATVADKEKGYIRLYRTGDLVRYLPDGNVEYIGRNDTQVKIRGFRIELAEIDAAIVNLSEVKQSAVVDYTDNEKTRLVAYLVTQPGRTIDTSKVHEQLGAVLPAYMLPSAYTVMEALPVTVNGKLDRKALPEPDWINQSNYIAPRTDLEIQLCEIWQDVLHQSKIGVNDNFFRIGGDSIVSIQLVTKMRQAGFQLQVKAIFEAPTVAELAKLLATSNEQNTVDTEEGLLTGAFPLLPIQHWFFKQNFAKPNHWNQSFMLQLPAGVTPAQIEKTLQALSVRHDILRCRFELQDDHWIQRYTDSPTNAELMRLDIISLNEASLIQTLTEWQSGFDIQQGPLWQVAHLTGDKDGRSRLFFTLHHLIVDAVSWRILAEDLQQHLSGQTLAPKTSSYRQWVDAVAKYGLQALDSKQELRYWQSVIAEMQEIPVENEEQIVDLSFSSDLTQSLLQEANAGYHTDINDLLLSALASALASTFDQSVNHIILEGHGREAINSSLDVSQTVGWFTNMYPVRLENTFSVANTIIHTKEMLRQIPTKGLGYGALVQAKVLSDQLPLVSFNYLGQFGNSSAGESDQGSDNWQFVTGPLGEQVPPENRGHLLLNLNGGVQNGQLQFGVISRLPAELTQTFVQAFESSLRSVVKQAIERVQQGSVKTPSDYGVPALSMSTLQRLQSQGELEGIYPATSLQQGFILHHVSQPDDDAYRVQILLDYLQALDVEAYKQAWRLASLKFPILRTAFNWESEPVQVISKGVSLTDEKFILEDISHLPEREKEAAITSIQQQDRKNGFDLTQPGLLRIIIIKQADDLYTVIKSEHHSIGDGWSLPVLFSAVHDFYNQLILGQVPAIQEDTAYMATQAYFQSQKAATDAFWAERRGSFPPANDVSAMLSHKVDLGLVKEVQNPAEQVLIVEGQAYTDLKKMCVEEGITLNVATQFAWHKLMQSYSADEATIVGTTVSGRDVPVEGIEASVGLYINTLPLLIDWSDVRRSIRDVFKAIQQDIADLNTHSAISLAKLQRDGERLFHSLFVFENYPMPNGDNQATGIERNLKARAGIEKVDYPLSVTVFEENSSLIIKLGHSEDWLSSNDAHELLNKFNQILVRIAEDTSASALALNIIDEEERHTLLVEHNATMLAYDQQQTLHGLFESQAANHLDTTALVFGETRLSYAELDRRSNQLAHAIREEYQTCHGKPMPPDTLIALYFERSIEMVVSMLAVLKAGGAYVPLSPTYPASRVGFILQDTLAGLLLTHQPSSEVLNRLLESQQLGTPVLLADSSIITEQPNTLVKVEVTPAQLAYVIYTSGTTGKPKGVMIEHGSAVDMMNTQGQRFYAERCQSALWFASYVFDASILEIFYALSFGMTGYLCEEGQRNAEGVIELLQRHEIEYTFLPPAILKQLSNERFPALNVLATGGEAPSAEFMQAFVKQCTVINAYGPTEFTVCATMHEYTPGDLVTCIGKATGNTKLYVLNESRQPVPMGVVGELYVSGPGLARGYLSRPELDAEMFITNPFVDLQEQSKGYARIYKTGDLVRYMPDGNLEYIGRTDSQVKIRGYRIELGEIEASLAEIAGESKAVVIDRERDGQSYLAAYLVMDEVDLDADHLASELGKRLPDYMVPSTFTAINNIPMTISGKLDRRVLPEPQWTNQDNFAAPRNALEARLCQIMQTVLKLEAFGIKDHFFRSGGDSISAVKLTTAIKRELNLTLPMSVLFRTPTVEGISQWMADDEVKISLLRPLTPASKAQNKMFMIHAAACGSEIYVELADKLVPRFNCYGIDNYNHTDNAMISELPSLAAHYLELILQETSVDEPIRLLAWSLGGLVALEMAYQLEDMGARNVKVVLLDTMLYDPELKLARQKIDDQALLAQQRQDLTASGVDSHIVDRLEKAFEIEIAMAYAHPSGKLKHTEVTLFKATEIQMKTQQLEYGARFNELVQQRPDNNVQQHIEGKLVVYPVSRPHESMLEEVELIREVVT